MRRIVLLCATLVLAVCIACGLYARDKVRRPHGPYTAQRAAERQIEHMAWRLTRADEQSERLSLEVLDSVRYGRFEAPMWLVRYAPPNPPARRVLLTGGVHGNEPAGAETVLRFIERLRRLPEEYPDTAFDIIPLVNPWGWAYNRRLNQQGYDINRDFGPFATQEARIVREFLGDQRYDVVIDHHEDGDALGFYLYNIATPHAPLCRELIAAVRDAGYPIEQDTWMVIFKTDDGLIDAPLWSLRVAQWALGNSLANYSRLRHAEAVYLIESPVRFPEKGRLAMQDMARTRLLERAGPP